MLLCYIGRVVTALVREFLDYFELEYTRSVFDPETNAVSCTLYTFLSKIHVLWYFVAYSWKLTQEETS